MIYVPYKPPKVAPPPGVRLECDPPWIATIRMSREATARLLGTVPAPVLARAILRVGVNDLDEVEITIDASNLETMT